MSILEYIEKYGCLSNGEHLEDVTVNLAGIEIRDFVFCFLSMICYCHASFVDCFSVFLMQGRIMSKRSSSSKLFFYDLHGGSVKVQVMADARYLISLSLCLSPHSYLICSLIIIIFPGDAMPLTN